MILVCVCTLGELCTAVVTVVILVLVKALGKSLVTVVTVMIAILIYTVKLEKTANVAIVILFFIYTLGDNLSTLITFVILVNASVFACGGFCCFKLCTTEIANKVCVLVSVGTTGLFCRRVDEIAGCKYNHRQKKDCR